MERSVGNRAQSTVLRLASLSGPFDPNLFSWNVGDPSATRWTVADDVNRRFRTERLVVVGGEELIASADMSAFYFIGSSRGTRALWRVDIDAAARHVVSGPHRLTTLPDASNASLSPDGRRVVFDGAARNAQIWSYHLTARMGSDAGPAAMTSDAAHADFPTLSRDGRALAFVLTRPGSPEHSELMARLPGQSRDRTVRVIEEPREILGMPRWNDTGTTLAYGIVSNVGGPAPQQQIRLIDASTRQRHAAHLSSLPRRCDGVSDRVDPGRPPPPRCKLAVCAGAKRDRARSGRCGACG